MATATIASQHNPLPLNGENLQAGKTCIVKQQNHWHAKRVIRKAQDANDYAETEKLMKILRSRSDEHNKFNLYAGHPPVWAQSIEVSCSS